MHKEKEVVCAGRSGFREDVKKGSFDSFYYCPEVRNAKCFGLDKNLKSNRRKTFSEQRPCYTNRKDKDIRQEWGLGVGH